ncbi:unnamed protein product [Mytilus edulis]|uniref:Uncharacterized protein n=1 Tax=Mytilus edulis TaxID=6550 RepID=A0A8S3RJN8_MYTED|nr:unnamed protein product [Mytilus edulis]
MSTFERKVTVGRYSLKRIVGFESFFHLAVLGGSLSIVEELIRQGADVNSSSKCWEEPLHIALKTGRHDMNELHKAVRHNDLENLRSNIRPANINSTTRRGLTVLHYAVLLDNVNAVKVLFQENRAENDDFYFEFTQDIQQEAVCNNSLPNVNIGDNRGLTAVHLAVMNNNIEILSLLLRNKADVNIRDNFYRTPLHYTTSRTATQLLLTHSSRKLCFECLRNTFNKREYEATPLSDLRTTF